MTVSCRPVGREHGSYFGFSEWDRWESQVSISYEAPSLNNYLIGYFPFYHNEKGI